MNRDIKIEVCAGGYADCVAAKQGGADRVELNGAFALGGLTPTVPVLKKVKRDTGLEVIAMVRPRAGGFCYDADEKEIMFAEAKNLRVPECRWRHRPGEHPKDGGAHSPAQGNSGVPPCD